MEHLSTCWVNQQSYDYSRREAVDDASGLLSVDVQGNEVGKVTSSKHSVSFATQAFTFSPLRDVVYQNVSAKEFTFETPIYDIGKLRLTLY